MMLPAGGLSFLPCRHHALIPSRCCETKSRKLCAFDVVPARRCRRRILRAQSEVRETTQPENVNGGRPGDVLENETNGSSVLFGEQNGTDPSRLWSNLGDDMKHEPGSVLGSAGLVAGTTVGAGILALPAVTDEAGFLASTLTIAAVCGFSIVTGLLVAEVNVNTMCELGSGGVSLVSMAERTLGKTGTRVASVTYVFLHYALLVAYISKGGGVVASFLQTPEWVGALAFNVTLGGVCYVANPRILDRINGALVGAVVISFLGLLGVAAGGVHVDALARSNWAAVPDTIPVVALAFVYHNIVPVIATNLEGDVSKVRTAIVGGSLVPLTMFVLWNGAILGSIDPNMMGDFQDPLDSLKASSATVGPLIESFSFLAIATSYIGFVLGLSDFLADALKLPSGAKQATPFAITLLPPFVLALTFRDVFFQALDAAGTYGVLVLFGIIPAVMTWSERYGGTTLSSVRIVPGGKPAILLVGGAASFVILREFLETVTGLF
ncbi:hypothetical protein BSKO_13701 [Bryopsis sp. KO-2023]|nr:hypothetical protein BSKO_13701 [Bryopsis sp. KO-2023]